MKYRNDLKIEFKAESFGSSGIYHVLMYRISPDQDLTYIEERSFLGFKYKVKKEFDTSWYEAYQYFNYPSADRYSEPQTNPVLLRKIEEFEEWKKCKTMEEFFNRLDKITPPANYLIGKITKVDNGMLVEFVKKRPQYPETFKDCCFILHEYPTQPSIIGYKYELLHNLRKLLICRDAYWKIAGKQMGLGESWKPENPSKRYIFTIENSGGNIIKNAITDKWSSRVLVFPTEEMRDMFYENFKELIEQCKELL